MNSARLLCAVWIGLCPEGDRSRIEGHSRTVWDL